MSAASKPDLKAQFENKYTPAEPSIEDHTENLDESVSCWSDSCNGTVQ